MCLVHIYLISVLCSPCRHGTTYSPGAHEQKQQRLLWGNARRRCTDITGIFATDFSRIMISCRTLLPWTRGLITQFLTNWLSRSLQGWFPSSLTPGVSSDLLQGPVWKLCLLYFPPCCGTAQSQTQLLCQAYLRMRHPCLHLNSFSFSPSLSQVSRPFLPFPCFSLSCDRVLCI